MKKNPLIVQLAKLSRKEMTRFSEFAASPYFNKHKAVRALTSYLSEIYPDFSDKKCERFAIYQKIFPKTAHNQAQLAIVFSYAARLLEQFLIVETLEAEGFLADKSLYYKQIRQRGVVSMLALDWPSQKDNPSFNPFGNEIPFQRRPSHKWQEIQSLTEKDAISIKMGQASTRFLMEKHEKLEDFYLAETLKDACELLQRSLILKAPAPSWPLYENLVDLLNRFPEMLESHPTAAVYLIFFNFLKNGAEGQFEKCMKAIRDYEQMFSREEQQTLYNYLQNFCIKQINKGEQLFLKELFWLYKLQLDNQLLLEDGKLPEWHYKNIVTTGLRLEELTWVREFIENYSECLPDHVAGNAYSYNLAVWYYHIGKPSDVLPLLLQVEYTDLRYNLDAKSLLLKAYFDLEEEEALIAHAEAFIQFVNRNKSLTDFQKRGYVNLVRFTLRIFKLKLGEIFIKEEKWHSEIRKTKQALENVETVFNRTWLVAKLEEVAKAP